MTFRNLALFACTPSYALGYSSSGNVCTIDFTSARPRMRASIETSPAVKYVPECVENFTHCSMSGAHPQHHPRTAARFMFSTRLSTSIFPSTAALTSVTVPLRPTAGMMSEMLFEYGAVQRTRDAPPRDLAYATTSVVEASRYSEAPSERARASFDEPEDTATTYATLVNANGGQTECMYADLEAEFGRVLNCEVPEASDALYKAKVAGLPWRSANSVEHSDASAQQGSELCI